MDGARYHQSGQLDRAAGLYEKVLRRQPNHPDALHLLGLIASNGEEHDRALDLISRAIETNSENAAYHNSLGTVLLALDRAGDAESSFRRALALNPAYAEAHNNLGNALQDLGRPEESLSSYNSAVQLNPQYAEAYCNCGRALQALGERKEAVAAFRRALELKPDYVKAHRSLGEVLWELGQMEDARASFERALALAPEDEDTCVALAAFFERSSKLEDGLAMAEQALRSRPGYVQAHVLAAKCEKRLGREREAIDRLEALNLENLDILGTDVALYELAALRDRTGDYERAYTAYKKANELAAETPQWKRVDKNRFPDLIVDLKTAFTAEWLASWTPPIPFLERQPVFLIGFPRSGTTLLDQILDAHPSLHTMEEKPAIDVVKQRVREMPGGYPNALAVMTAEDVAGLRQIYFAEVASYMDGVPDGILVDKHPLNIMDVGLIHRLFPEAKLLLALRHPCDVVLSGFMQYFEPNMAMVQFGSLPDTARFYQGVMGLWQQYEATLPVSVHPSRYEDLVAEFEPQTRRILDFLEVPWDDAILAYAERAKGRRIATPSYHQVVQPIYSRSVSRWLNYREPMEQVLPILRPFIDAFGYGENGSIE